jgi:tellurite methyltransferase
LFIRRRTTALDWRETWHPTLDKIGTSRAMVSRWLQEQAAIDDEHSRAPLFDVRTGPSVQPAWTGATTFAGVDPTHPHSLAARLHELPPPHERLSAGVLASSSASACAARDILHSRGYVDVHIVAVGDLRAHTPELANETKAQGSLGQTSRALWYPSPTLLESLPRVLAILEKQGEDGLKMDALDIGAGSGRDAAFLALCGWTVTAVDRDSELVDKAVALGNRSDQRHLLVGRISGNDARRGSVNGVARTFGATLAEDKLWLRAHAATLVVVVRFLRRGVLQMLGDAVRDGGFILYEHFLVGCELHKSGPRKQSQMLRGGELARLFGPRTGFDVLLDQVVYLADGRPCNRFLARKTGCPIAKSAEMVTNR